MLSSRCRTMLVTSIASLTLGFTTIGFVTTQPIAAADAIQDAVVDEDMSLHDHMENVKDNLRAIMRGVSDPDKKSEVLENVTQLQKHLLGAKMHTPPALDEQPASERDAYLLGFRKALAQALGEATKLEIDVIEDRPDDAIKRIRENIIDLRDAAHEIYQIEDDD